METQTEQRKESIKMLTTTLDPRQFVKSVPLPIPSQKGIKIQARSEEVYNPTIPTRDDVRRINYARRQAQLTQQGFRSPIHKPYQGIGDPFYLDQKKLILHALGQWQEGDDLDETSSDNSSDNENQIQANQKKAKMTSRSFVKRKIRKDQNTLSKEVSHGRELIRGVKLGRGLFQLLQQENEQRTEAKQKELQKKRENMWNEWQPPRSDDDSGSDLSEDDDLHKEVDLRRFMVESSVFEGAEEEHLEPAQSTAFLTQPPEPKPHEARSVVFRDVESVTANNTMGYGKSTTSVNLSSMRQGSKKKSASARPFTPVYANICADYNRVVSKEQRDALFRQLCALYWLLEAMNCNDPAMMSSITTCWNLRDIGGFKTSPVAKQHKEKCENNWKRFTSNQVFRSHAPRYSAVRQGIKSGLRRSSTLQRSSMSSTPSGSQSQLNLSGSGSVIGPQPAGIGSSRKLDPAVIPEDVESVIDEKDEDDKASEHDGEKPVFEDRKYSMTEGGGLGHYETTTSHKNSAVNRSHLDLSSVSQKRRISSGPKRQTIVTIDSSAVQRNLQAQILESINRSEEDPRLHRLANPTEKRSSSSLRAEYNIRPRSTQEVLDYQATLPSNKLNVLPIKLRNEFDDVTEEKAQTLHDTLEAIDRDRMRKLRSMFARVPTKTSLHRALELMRPKVINTEEEREKRRRSSMHQQWYIDLTNTIPDDIRQDWFFEKILNKLSKYGLVEASKQSSYKFRRVLKGLRDWEICSPDICAAIEFCREKIVEMSVEEYEEWFVETFPAVVRPQTAPPAIKGSKSEGRAALNKEKGGVPKSAPPGVRIKDH